MPARFALRAFSISEARMTNEVTSIGVGMETDGIERGIKSLKTLAEQGPKVEQAMAGVRGDLLA